MSKYGILFYLIFCLSSSVSAETAAERYDNNAYSSALFKSLSKAKQSNGFSGVNKTVSSMDKTLENMNILSVFLRDSYLKAFHEPRYGLMYAYSLQAIIKMRGFDGDKKHGLNNTASMVYFSSRLTARENVARCKDTSAGQGYLMNWRTPMAKDMYIFVQNLPDQEKDKFINTVLSISGRRDVDIKDRMPCKDGIKYVPQAMKANKCKKIPYVRTINGVQLKGSNTVCDGTDFVEFIGDKEWALKRKENQREMVEYLKRHKEK